MSRRRDIPSVRPSNERCTVVDIDRHLRCIHGRRHGWYHEFDRYIRQDICLSRMFTTYGTIKRCMLPSDHWDMCVYLDISERPIRLEDVFPWQPNERDAE